MTIQLRNSTAGSAGLKLFKQTTGRQPGLDPFLVEADRMRLGV